jgi:hypothetical protein
MGNFAGNDFLRDALLQLLRRHYEKGYRLNSPIEIKKLRAKWKDEHGGEELRASDEAVRKAIASLTVSAGGMAYLIAQDVKDWLQFIVTLYLGKSEAIFYEAFFARHQEKLTKAHIFDEQILQAVFEEIFPRFHYGKVYFGKAQGAVPDVVRHEILDIWGEKTLWTYEQLEERLYIPLDAIKQVLGQQREFLWVAEGTYTHISRVNIDDEVKEKLRQEAQNLAQGRDFWSIKELAVDDVLAANYELETKTNSAIYDAVYAICLEADFDRKGDTLTRKQQEDDHVQGKMAQKMSAAERMREYCRSRDVCTLSEMQRVARSFTKNTVAHLRAGAEVMVRLDKEHYVSDSYVNFNIVGTDEAISRIVMGDYLALREFVTFAHFPECGAEWNLFLLESYCRRFSREFRFETSEFNSNHVGTVIRKLAPFKNYDELQADAVFRANIGLDCKTVGQFLYDSGYIGKIPIDRQLDHIIKLAKARV